jgi:hypothetical protein
MDFLSSAALLACADWINDLKDAVQQLCDWAGETAAWGSKWPAAHTSLFWDAWLDDLRNNLDLIGDPPATINPDDKWAMDKSTYQTPPDGTLTFPPAANCSLGGTVDVVCGHWFDNAWPDPYERCFIRRGYVRFILPPRIPGTVNLALTARRKDGPLGETTYDGGYKVRVYTMDDIRDKPTDQTTRDALWAGDKTQHLSDDDFTLCPNKEQDYNLDIELTGCVPGPVIVFLGNGIEIDSGSPTYDNEGAGYEYDQWMRLEIASPVIEP